MIIDENALQLLSHAINFCNSIKLYGYIYDLNQNDYIEFSDFQIQNLAFTIDWNSKIELYRELDDCPEELCSTVNVKDFLALYSHINDYELLTYSPRLGGLCYQQPMLKNLSLTRSPARVDAPTLF